VNKPAKVSIVFQKEKKPGEKKNKDKTHAEGQAAHAEGAAVDPLKAKEEKKKKKSGLISATFKKNKYAVTVCVLFSLLFYCCLLQIASMNSPFSK